MIFVPQPPSISKETRVSPDRPNSEFDLCGAWAVLEYTPVLGYVPFPCVKSAVFVLVTTMALE